MEPEDIQVTVKDNRIVISMPFDSVGRPSQSGKTIVHATTGGGIKSLAKIGNLPIYANVSCYTNPRKDG